MKKLAPFLILGVFLLYVAESLLRPAAAPDGFDLAALGRLPVVANGRVQPFDSVGRNALLQIRSTASVPLEEKKAWQFWKHPKKLGATEWLLEVMAKPAAADKRKIFLVHHPELLGELELVAQAGSGLSYYSFSELAPKLAEIEGQSRRVDEVKPEERSAADRQVAKLYNALLVYQRLKNSLQPNSSIEREGAGDVDSFNFAGQLALYVERLPAASTAFAAMRDGKEFDKEAMTPALQLLQPFQLVEKVALPLLIPPADPARDRTAWQSIGAGLLGSIFSGQLHPVVAHWALIGTSFARERPADLNRAVAMYRDWLIATGLEPELRKGEREHAFNSFRPFVKATAIYLVAFILGCAFWLSRSKVVYRSAVLLVGLAFAIHTGGLLFRMLLEGRPPVTNLYSSAIFVGWGAVVLGLVLERFYRNGIGTVTAALIGLVTQIIAHNLALGGDTMQMMQAVLDNNFWLSTHVVVITLGYSSMLVAGFMAAAYILVGVLTPWLTADRSRSLERMVYGILCFATLFSFVGTVLGGIWADQSWGRFWGWDPKENGALMIVLWAAVYLHVRWGRLAGPSRQMALVVGGNIVTSFSWFGVNMLGVGLHSYGFMDSAFRWLAYFVSSQLVIIALGLLPQRLWLSFRDRQATPRPLPAQAGVAAPVPMTSSAGAERARTGPRRHGNQRRAARPHGSSKGIKDRARPILVVLLLLGTAAAAAAQETTRFLPAVASSPGANGTVWRTDARVFNPSATGPIAVALALLPPGSDNTDAGELSIAVPPRQAVAMNDLVATLFAASGSGAVRLRSDQPFLASSKTYNIGDGSSGTYGLLVPSLAPWEALTQGILLQVANDPAPSGFRSNVGFVNPGLATATATYRVYDADSATLIGESSRTLPPLGYLQVNNVFASVAAADIVVRNATVEVTASAPLFAYASVVDNRSGDAVLVLPEADSGTPEAGATVLADDTFTAVANVPLSIPAAGVLGNDSAAGGSVLAAMLESPPADRNGSVVLNADGSFVYLYGATIEAPVDDSFTYRAGTEVATVRVTVLPAVTLTDVRVSYRLDPWLIAGTYGGGIWVSPPVFGPVRQNGDAFVMELRADARHLGQPVAVSPSWITGDPAIVVVSPSDGDQVTLELRRPGETSLYVESQGVRSTLAIRASSHQGVAMEVEITQP